MNLSAFVEFAKAELVERTEIFGLLACSVEEALILQAFCVDFLDGYTRPVRSCDMLSCASKARENRKKLLEFEAYKLREQDKALEVVAEYIENEFAKRAKEKGDDGETIAERLKFARAFLKMAAEKMRQNNETSDDCLEEIKKIFINGEIDKLAESAPDWDKILDSNTDEKTPALLEKMPLILNLIRLGWIETAHKNEMPQNMDDTALASLWLYNKEIRLGSEFFGLFFELPHAEPTPYKSQLEYINDEILRVDLIVRLNERNLVAKRLNSARQNLKAEFKKPPNAHAKDALARHETYIAKRLKLTKNRHHFGILKFFKQYGLDKNEQLIFINLLRTNWRDYAFEVEATEQFLLGIISKDESESAANRAYFKADSRLLKNELIGCDDEVAPDGMFVKTYYIYDEVLRQIIEKEGDTAGKKRKITLAQAIKEQDIFELITPKNTLDDVVLEPSTRSTLENLLSQVDARVIKRLKEWGIKDKKRGIDAKVLFFGPAGTGKTMSALGLAKSLKRPVLSFDCSKILSMWVGESEKNVRAIFDRYDEICQNTNDEPILLLDEADQFLSARSDAPIGSEKMHNQMQNIFLERLEKFDGLLIATTNLLETFDGAFSRRFNYKIKFERPNRAQRRELWLRHFPKNAKFAQSVESLADALSEHDLSGGQIALIVKNTAYKVAAQKTPIFTQSAFVDEIKRELEASFDAKKPVGFVS